MTFTVWKIILLVNLQEHSFLWKDPGTSRIFLIFPIIKNLLWVLVVLLSTCGIILCVIGEFEWIVGFLNRSCLVYVVVCDEAKKKYLAVPWKCSGSRNIHKLDTVLKKNKKKTLSYLYSRSNIKCPFQSNKQILEPKSDKWWTQAVTIVTSWALLRCLLM